MIYVMSDMHGCYEEYLECLKQVNFNDDDTLYVLGDVIDRGKDPIRLLRDMSMRSNVIPILGNHEFAAMTILPELLKEITLSNINSTLNEEFWWSLQAWIQDGGQITIDQFKTLPLDERAFLMEYMKEFMLYEQLEINGKQFVLAHAGIGYDIPDVPLENIPFIDFIFTRPDFNKRYLTNSTLIVGHTPTLFIDRKYMGKIYCGDNLIDVDTGCVYGGCCTILCLNTMEAIGVRKDTKETIRYTL